MFFLYQSILFVDNDIDLTNIIRTSEKTKLLLGTLKAGATVYYLLYSDGQLTLL